MIHKGNFILIIYRRNINDNVSAPSLYLDGYCFIYILVHFTFHTFYFSYELKDNVYLVIMEFMDVYQWQQL